jgi:phosphate transport system substrate-binding protein
MVMMEKYTETWDVQMKKLLVTGFLICSVGAGAVHAQTDIQGAGASFPSVIYQAWGQQYEKQSKVKVVYTPTGSGDGVKKIMARVVAFGATDVPLSEADLVKNKLLQLPTMVGGIVPVVNLKGVAANDLRLTGSVLADIFSGKITVWNDKQIAALNPGVNLPALPIVRVVRKDASGSTEALTRYLSLVSAPFKTEVGESNKPNWPAGASALEAYEGNDGVVKEVRKTAGAIGYVSYDRVLKGGLVAVRLRTADGSAFVQAGEESFRAAVKESNLAKNGDESASLLNMPGSAAWPITLATFILIDAEPKTAASVAAAMQFLYWTQLSGDGLLKNTGFTPLPARVQAKFAARFSKVKPQDGQLINLM